MQRWQVRYQRTNLMGQSVLYTSYTDLNMAYVACQIENKSWHGTYFFWVEECE